MTEPTVQGALEILHSWMQAAGDGFHPQEETLQLWLAAALVEARYCDPQELVSELTLGESSEKGEREDWDHLCRLAVRFPGVGSSGKYLRFDLAVLDGAPRGAVRSFGSCTPPPKLVMEVKALNSAGGLKRRDIVRDIRKLDVAQRWWARHGESIEVVMVVLATAAKVTRSQTTVAMVEKWVKTFAADPAIPAGIPVALVLPDTVEFIC